MPIRHKDVDMKETREDKFNTRRKKNFFGTLLRQIKDIDAKGLLTYIALEEHSQETCLRRIWK